MRAKPATPFVAVLLFLSTTVGCASMQTQRYSYAPKENDGVVTVYREFSFNAGGVKAILEVDDQGILGLDNKEFAAIRVSPGNHRIAVKASTTVQKDVRELVIKEGERVYLQVEANSARALSALLPFVDILAVKTFLFRESTREEFSSVAKGSEEIPVEYSP